MSAAEQSKTERLIWAVMSLISVVFLYFLTARAGFGFDACDYYIAAEDWLRGLSPYKDYFFSKTPGILFLTALFFKIFSSHAVWLAWYTTWINVGWAAAAAWAVAPLIGRRLAFWVFPAALWVALCCMVNFWNTEQPMTLFVSLGTGLWLRIAERKRRRLELLVGLLLGIAAIFKLFAVLSVLSLLVLTWTSLNQPFHERLKRSADILGGLALAGFAIIIWAWSEGVLGAMLKQSVITPLYYYKSHESYLSDFLRRVGWFVIPLGLFMGAGVLICLLKRDYLFSRPDFVLGVLGLPYLLPLFKNQAAHYVIPFVPFAVAWAIWMFDYFSGMLSKKYKAGLLVFGVFALMAVLVSLVLYKKGSFERVFFQDALARQRKAYSELAKWAGKDERVIFINAGPYPHLNLYWGTGARPYPWPFIAVMGFPRHAIEQFGFEKFYRICDDEKTRILAINLDVPMEQTLSWPYSDTELKKLKRLIQNSFFQHPIYPHVYLRNGSVPKNTAFWRGPYKGEKLE